MKARLYPPIPPSLLTLIAVSTVLFVVKINIYLSKHSTLIDLEISDIFVYVFLYIFYSKYCINFVYIQFYV